MPTTGSNIRKYTRCIVAIALLGAISMSALGQRRYSPEFYIGGHAGATLSKMTFSPSVPQSMLPGFMAGITARYTEENHFGLIAEINIEQRGWKENFDGKPFDYSRSLTYIQIPLLTHIYFGSQHFRGFVNAGPEVAYMIGSNISSDFDYENITSIEGFPLRNRTNEQLAMAISNRFDYGISAGAGMEWKLTRTHCLLIEGRFYYGLGNIFPSTKRDVFNASRGMSIQVTAGYMFRVR